jgi:2-C-methyl-D-erythritol 4-phosphate cytidylyltransferase/2-C-methyl-D-erythritol 2,4-cyclodiphosphate synthase
MSHVTAVVVAAGRGSRFGSPKQFLPLAGHPMVEWSVEAFLTHPEVDEVILVLPPDCPESVSFTWSGAAVRTCTGGDTRRASAAAGTAQSDRDTELILIHDAARPFVTAGLISRVISAAARTGAAVPVTSVVDTIKRVRKGRVVETIDRAELKRAQTPQGFAADLIRQVHARAAVDGAPASDDASLCERAGHPVTVVEGDPWNLKITAPGDLALAEWLVTSGRVSFGGRAGAGE